MASRPVSVNPKQRLIADMLASGATVREVAKKTHVQPSYIEILLKGSLFSLEVDRARERYVKSKLNAFAKKVAEELETNVEVAKSIRDNAQAKDCDRLRAIEILTDRIVPRPKPHESDIPSATARIVLSDERSKLVQDVFNEIDISPERRKEEIE